MPFLQNEWKARRCRKKRNTILAFLLILCISVSSAGGSRIEVRAAKETLPGIQNIRNQIMQSEDGYRILEIVPERGASEIGYYINGQDRKSVV